MKAAGREFNRLPADMLSLLKSDSLCRRFGWLGILALLCTLPYGIPAFYDVFRVWMGGDAGAYVYLLKPVENQLWYLIIGAGMIAFAWCIWRVIAPDASRTSPAILIYGGLAAAMLGGQIASALLSEFPAPALKGLLMPASCWLVFMIIISLRPNEAQMQQLFFLVIAATVPACIYAMAQNQGYELLPYSRFVAEGGTKEISGKQSIASVFGHPNYMGSYLGPLIFWPAFFVLGSRSILVKWVAGGAGILMVAALVAGGTRGPWLAVGMAAVAYYFMLALSPKYRRQLLFSAGLAAFIAVILLVVPNPFFSVRFDVSRRVLGSQEISSRFYYWLMATEMWKSHPMLGVGFGRFDVNFWDYVDAYQQKPDSGYFRYVLQETIRGIRPGFVHNDHLQILAEGGLVGAALWIALWSMLGAHWTQLIRALRHDHARLLLVATMAASLIVFAVDAAVNFPMHIPCSRLLFWTMIGCWACLASQYGVETQGRRPDSQ